MTEARNLQQQAACKRLHAGELKQWQAWIRQAAGAMAARNRAVLSGAKETVSCRATGPTEGDNEPFIYKKGPAFGMPGVLVDGMDVMKVCPKAPHEVPPALT